MALRAELVGPYCLISVMSSVCADQMKPSGGIWMARMSLPELTAAALKYGCSNVVCLVQGLSVNN